jgi:hypothetical protein
LPPPAVDEQLPAGQRRTLLLATCSSAAGLGFLCAAWALSRWPMAVLTSVDHVFRAAGMDVVPLEGLAAVEQRRRTHEFLTVHARAIPPCPGGTLLHQQHGNALGGTTPVLEVYWRTALPFRQVLDFYRTALPAAGWVVSAPGGVSPGLDALRDTVRLLVERPDEGSIGLTRPPEATHVLTLHLAQPAALPAPG